MIAAIAKLFRRRDARTHTCPHCQHDLGDPKGKRKCPACGNKLVRFKDWETEQTLFVTEEQRRELQRNRVRKSALNALQELQRNRIHRAEISAVIDSRSTENCIKADGTVWPVIRALREMPLPHDGDGECRCSFVGHFK